MNDDHHGCFVDLRCNFVCVARAQQAETCKDSLGDGLGGLGLGLGDGEGGGSVPSTSGRKCKCIAKLRNGNQHQTIMLSLTSHA